MTAVTRATSSVEGPVAIVDDVREFLRTTLQVQRADAVTVDEALVDRGVIDSIELMQVVAFVEAQYGVRVADADVSPGNFGSLASIERYVQDKLA